ncbi:CAP domain-containing protein [uncultured Jatrophihabitans sp.]|uniref:CAP domain-containing protein n=1 Tax=uncultured Jatrophihabitans sp. TaxID=1610747 RepID=UPI0035C9EDFE
MSVSRALFPVSRIGRLRSLVALLVGAIALTVLAVPQSASARTVTHARTTSEHQMAVALVHRLNAERRAHHLRPLTTSGDLERSARRHDVTMARFDEMSHQLPSEPVFTARIRAAGYRWVWAGENIAWNSRISTAGVLQLQSMMYNEKAPFNDHRLNILSPHYRNVGVDVFVDRTNQRVWLTTDFGSH